MKMSAQEQSRVLAWAEATPLSAPELLARHLDAGGIPVHAQTIKTLLHKEDFVCKRTRASLQKRDEAVFRLAKAEIEQLRQQAAAGKMVLGYLDEAGFSCVHTNRSTWTKVASQHLIAAVRGQRLNVLGALMSTGHFESVQFTGSMTSALLLEFLADIAGKYSLPVTLVVDDASVKRSHPGAKNT